MLFKWAGRPGVTARLPALSAQVYQCVCALELRCFRRPADAVAAFEPQVPNPQKHTWSNSAGSSGATGGCLWDRYCCAGVVPCCRARWPAVAALPCAKRLWAGNLRGFLTCDAARLCGVGLPPSCCVGSRCGGGSSSGQHRGSYSGCCCTGCTRSSGFLTSGTVAGRVGRGLATE